MSLPSRYRAAPDGLVAAVLLSFLATAGLFYVNIMPALVDGLKTGLGFSAREAGFVASANVYGAALGAFSAVFTVKRLSWRKVALAALIGLIAIDLVSTQLKTVQVLIAVRFLHGVVGGFLVGTSYGVFARTKAPDRVFGMLLVVQFGLGGLGVLLLPRLAPIYGTPVLFIALAAFSIVTLIMLPFLDDYPRPAASLESAHGRVLWVPLATALAAVFLFQCANMALASYVIGLGRTFRLEISSITGALGVANWLGALGSVAVVVIGVRFGRAGSIMAGMALALAGTVVFLMQSTPWAYAAANVLTSVAWSFTIAYLLGLCAAFDTTGRSAALAGFCSKMGLASGPAFGGLLLEETHYPRLVVLSCVGLALAAAAAVWPAVKLDRTALG
ncbi:MFS transporter [Phenylobacterium montanum]|uniref:MFS transporter n=1 Tax=Phenylobacterium montanum TaxID=2823693 RepID=A0A975FV41_9CAUL|nr:MFS transporter [Caulobacter sp. S6]QUD85955.1 MFS transporter [Caulobacter sp. S6]